MSAAARFFHVATPFRDNIHTYAPPDRGEWAREHGGREPQELKAVAPHYIAQAGRQLAKDFATIEREPAIAAQTVLDEICEGVLHRSGLDPDAHVVHFDPGTKSFWAYPL